MVFPESHKVFWGSIGPVVLGVMNWKLQSILACDVATSTDEVDHSGTV